MGKPGCAKVCFIHKVSISVRGSRPTEYMVYWAHQSTHPIRHFDRFSRFSTDHGRRGVTSSQTHTCIHIHNERGGLKTRDWKSQDWKTWDQIAGVEKAGLVNAGTSCAWVAKCNCRNSACRNSADPPGSICPTHCERSCDSRRSTHSLRRHYVFNLFVHLCDSGCGNKAVNRYVGSVAEWLACSTQTQLGLQGSNRSRDAVG